KQALKHPYVMIMNVLINLRWMSIIRLARTRFAIKAILSGTLHGYIGNLPGLHHIETVALYPNNRETAKKTTRNRPIAPPSSED
ncbi:MAG: hypothetical protein M0011_13730, partial [Elusimicrobia bacterium]|nr:hypothetical protein [Elusimicrobiota bacterium]